MRQHPHIGWLLVRSERHGAVALGARGADYLDEERVEGEDPLALFRPTRGGTCGDGQLLQRRRHHGRQLLRPSLDEGCAFEELISFHGGLGGPQTRGFILSPPALALPERELVGAAAVHAQLLEWRWALQRVATPVP